VQVAERWFEHREIDEGIVLIREPYVDLFLQANLFLVRGRDRDLLVDSGLGLASLRTQLADLWERPVTVVATHRHFDHTGGLHEFDDIVVHRLDAEAVTNAGVSRRCGSFTARRALRLRLPRRCSQRSARASTSRPIGSNRSPHCVVDEGDLIDLGDRQFEVPLLPGHTPASSGCGRRIPALFPATASTGGILLDELPSRTSGLRPGMERLRDVPVRVVHGGHTTFGRAPPRADPGLRGASRRSR
jgi:glyoxylase-like metal-dependent hydrolase (beta-lactamase superfamily II)